MKRFLLAGLCLVFCLAPAAAEKSAPRQATLAYLKSLQTPDGGFLPARPLPGGDANPVKPGLRATSGAVRALKYFGGEPKDRAAAGRFVASCFDKAAGGFADQPGGKPDVTSTAVGLMAVVELKLPVETYRAAAVKYLGDNVKTFEDIRIAVAGLEAVHVQPSQRDAWLEQIAKLRQPDGAYGKGDGAARATGSAVVAVLRLEGTVEHKDVVLKTLKAGQRPDGGFGKEGVAGSDLETSYRIMRAFHMLKEKPADVPAFRAFVTKCRNADGGYGVAPGQPSGAGGSYFAAIILHWLAEG